MPLEGPWGPDLEEWLDDTYDEKHADAPQCGYVGVNGSGDQERCIRREGHPGKHHGMGSE